MSVDHPDGGAFTPAQAATGAGEVLGTVKETVDDATVRVTLATPTAGKKIRVIDVQATSSKIFVSNIEVYFGTGVTVMVDPSKVVFLGRARESVVPSVICVFPDGGGPVGAVDEVVSMRWDHNITTGGFIAIHYREE